jgi:transcriptional antiterminator NusG
MFENAINLGHKVFPPVYQPTAEIGYETRQIGAVAVNKNLFPRHCSSGIDRLLDQADFLCPTRRLEMEGWNVSEEKAPSTSIFAVRTTAGQEKNVANLIAVKIGSNKLPIKAVLVPEMLKGYVFVEAEGPHFVEDAISGIKHVRSRVPGIVSFSEVEKYIVVKPVIEELDVDDVVEVVSGPFKSMRAKITRIDKTKSEVTLELLEATFTLPITVHADYVKVVEKTKKVG